MTYGINASKQIAYRITEDITTFIRKHVNTDVGTNGTNCCVLPTN